ncbi:Rho-GAP domain-containing protein [Entamoeba marina]
MSTPQTPRRNRPTGIDSRLYSNGQCSEIDIRQNFFTTPRGGRPNLEVLGVVKLANESEELIERISLSKHCLRYAKLRVTAMSFNRKNRKQTTPPLSDEEKRDSLMDSFQLIGTQYANFVISLEAIEKYFAKLPQRKRLINQGGDVVLITCDQLKEKSRRIILRSNFLLIYKESGVFESIHYLSSPKISLASPNTLCINTSITIEYKTPEKCIEWISLLKNLQPWYETIPRTIILNSITTAPLFKRNKTIKTMDGKQKSEEPTQRPKKKIFLSRLSSRTKPKTVRIVGVSLQQYCEDNLSVVPPVNVSLLISYLKDKVEHVEGIFRVSGGKDTIAKIVEKLDENTFSLEKLATVDIHSVAGALKLYITKLPDQVIPKAIDDKLYELWKTKETFDDDEFLKEFASIFLKAPPIIINFLKDVLDLVRIIDEHKDETKMTVENSITCLAPALRGYPFVYTYVASHYSQIFS